MRERLAWLKRHAPLALLEEPRRAPARVEAILVERLGRIEDTSRTVVSP
jgi:hypothetical protein